MVKKRYAKDIKFLTVSTMAIIVCAAASIMIMVIGIKAEKTHSQFLSNQLWKHILLYICPLIPVILVALTYVLFSKNTYLKVLGVLLHFIAALLFVIFGFCSLAGYLTLDFGYKEELTKNRIAYETSNKCCFQYDAGDTKDRSKYWVKTFRDCPFINEQTNVTINNTIRIDNKTCEKLDATQICNVIDEDEYLSLFCGNKLTNDKTSILILMIIEFVYAVIECVFGGVAIKLYLPAFRALASHLKGIQITESGDSDDEINHINDDQDVDMKK